MIENVKRINLRTLFSYNVSQGKLYHVVNRGDRYLSYEIPPDQETVQIKVGQSSYNMATQRIAWILLYGDILHTTVIHRRYRSDFGLNNLYATGIGAHIFKVRRGVKPVQYGVDVKWRVNFRKKQYIVETYEDAVYLLTALRQCNGSSVLNPTNPQPVWKKPRIPGIVKVAAGNYWVVRTYEKGRYNIVGKYHVFDDACWHQHAINQCNGLGDNTVVWQYLYRKYKYIFAHKLLRRDLASQYIANKNR